MLDLAASVSKIGMMWSSGAHAVVEYQCRNAVDAAAVRLADEVRREASVASGAMKRSVDIVGRGLAKRVVVGAWYALPVDQGYKAVPVPAQKLAEWVETRGIASGARAMQIAFAINRSRRGRKVQPQNFFFETWNRMHPVLFGQYLGPLGVQIARALG